MGDKKQIPEELQDDEFSTNDEVGQAGGVSEYSDMSSAGSEEFSFFGPVEDYPPEPLDENYFDLDETGEEK